MRALVAVFAAALAACPAAEWTVGSIREDGDDLVFAEIERDGSTPASFDAAVLLATPDSLKYGPPAAAEKKTCGRNGELRVRPGRCVCVAVSLGGAWTASAFRASDGTWSASGLRSRPVAGIEINGGRPLVSVSGLDPANGSELSILGSEDLKTWAPADGSSKYFKIVQRRK